MPEQLGNKEERGYLYPCKDVAWIDESGFRKKGILSDITDKMMIAHYDNKQFQTNPKILPALEFAKQHDWQIVTRRWIDLFDEAILLQENPVVLSEEV
jgi:hypothetical protein